MDAGVGHVQLHNIVDYPEATGERILPWLGAYWVRFESGWDTQS